MMTTSTTTKLFRAASAALVLALVPGLAAADTAEKAADTLKLTLNSVPGTVLETVPAAVARGVGSDVGALALGGSLGFGAGDFPTLFKLNGDLQYTVSEISPKTYFDLAGHVGFGFGSHTFIFEMVPKARIRYAVDSKLSLYGDGGLGFALEHVSGVDVFDPFTGQTITVGGGTNGFGLLRFSGGIQYKVTPTVILVGEPVGLNIYFGSGTGFMYSFMVGALFRV